MGYLRFILALAVVLHHTPGSPYLFSGAYAVELFFCVSGFYMAMVIEGKYKDNTLIFYTNRLFRLAPTYILAIFFGILALLFDASESITRGEYVEALKIPGVWYLILSNATLLGQEYASYFSWDPIKHQIWFDAAQLSGVPAWKLLIIPQSWSISLELLFYVMAPFVVQRTKLKFLLTLLLLSFAIKMSVILLDIPYNSWGRRAFPSVMYLFLVGVVAYHFMNSCKERIMSLSPWIAWGGMLMLFLLLYKFRHPQVDEYMTVYPFVTIYGASLIPVLFLRLGSKFEVLIGELSYPMYLFHTVWIGVFAKAFNMTGLDLSVAVVFATILSAYVVYRYVEKPLDVWRQKRIGAV
jgi:peptidoglycan/LPS O-acetylase OafA/YrhL